VLATAGVVDRLDVNSNAAAAAVDAPPRSFLLSNHIDGARAAQLAARRTQLITDVVQVLPYSSSALPREAPALASSVAAGTGAASTAASSSSVAATGGGGGGGGGGAGSGDAASNVGAASASDGIGADGADLQMPTAAASGDFGAALGLDLIEGHAYQLDIAIECSNLVTKGDNNDGGGDVCNPLVGLFALNDDVDAGGGDAASGSGGGDFFYVDQTERVEVNRHPTFSTRLLVDYTPGAQSPDTLLKFSVYDVDSDKIRERDRVGSVLVRLSFLLAHLNRDVSLPLAHRSHPALHGRLRGVDARISLACELIDLADLGGDSSLVGSSDSGDRLFGVDETISSSSASASSSVRTAASGSNASSMSMLSTSGSSAQNQSTSRFLDASAIGSIDEKNDSFN
jgi:hypothetical protein